MQETFAFEKLAVDLRRLGGATIISAFHQALKFTHIGTLKYDNIVSTLALVKKWRITPTLLLEINGFIRSSTKAPYSYENMRRGSTVCETCGCSFINQYTEHQGECTRSDYLVSAPICHTNVWEI